MWTIQMDEDDFRIVGPNGEESELTPYGCAAVVESVEGTVFCYIEDPNSGDPEVKRIATAETLESETADVEFEADDEGDGNEDEDEDEGEPVEVKAESD